MKKRKNLFMLILVVLCSLTMAFPLLAEEEAGGFYLEWSHDNTNTSVSYYNLCYGTASRSVAYYDNCIYVPIPLHNPSSLEYSVNGLTPGQIYFCSVISYDENGQLLKQSNETSIRTRETMFNTHPTLFPTWSLDYNLDGLLDTLFIENGGMYALFGSRDEIPPEAVLICNGFGGWDASKHIIEITHMDSDNRWDIVGFGNSGVLVSWGIDGTTSSQLEYIVYDYGYNQDWSTDHHQRYTKDIDNNNSPDIIGIGNFGVKVLYNNGDRTFKFSPNTYVISGFGYAGGNGWLIPYHIRKFSDIDNDGAVDFLGIGNSKIYIHWGLKDSNGSPTGAFGSVATTYSDDFCNFHGWKKDRHVRLFTDIDKDGDQDMVGFGDSDVLLLRNNGDRSFTKEHTHINEFGHLHGWTVHNLREVKDVDKDGEIDISGWKDGVRYVSLQKNGAFTEVVAWE